MNRFVDLISPAARDLGSLTADFSAPPASTKLIRLDSNENPFGPSPRAQEAIRAASAGTHTYPDDHCLDLRRALAARHELPPEQVLVTAGSAGMIGLLCQALLAPGRNAVTSAVSFIVYGMAVRAAGARLIETPLREDGFDLEAILAAIDSQTRLVFLASPNNPTGTMLDAKAIDSFLRKVPAHVVVALDEAYFDFAAHFAALRGVEYSRALDYVRRDARVVVLRTFSKAHGLAGLRVGYGLGSAELLGYCARLANTYSVSSVSQAAALAALEDQEHVKRAVVNNADQARFLQDRLSELGYRTVPTSANFVYFDAGEDACGMAAALLARDICVRPLNAWGAPRCIRVTVGTPEQNQAFLRALERIKPETKTKQRRHARPAR